MGTENKPISQRNEKRPATLYDVAARAGVSKVAVSVVLNGARSNTRVAEATKHRILEAAKDLRYRPNGIARSLRRRHTNIIGFYTGDWYLDAKQLFYSRIISGLQSGCHAQKKDLLVHGAFRGHSAGDIYSELIDGKIDGLVVFARSDDPLAAHLAASPLPVVAIADRVEGLPCVVADDSGGSEMIACYLSEKGHRRVLYRKGHPLQTSALRRHRAFCDAAEALGITVIEHDAYGVGSDRVSDEEAALLTSRDPDIRPTAVVAWADRPAYGVLDFCEEQAIAVPDRLAVVGFDGYVGEIKPAVHLTTIRAPWDVVAETAVSLLAKRMRGESVPLETVLPVEFAVGETA